MLRFHLCTILIIRTNVFQVGAATLPPDVTCSQQKVAQWLDDYFCMTSDGNVVLHSEPSPCTVTSPATPSNQAGAIPKCDMMKPAARQIAACSSTDLRRSQALRNVCRANKVFVLFPSSLNTSSKECNIIQGYLVIPKVVSAVKVCKTSGASGATTGTATKVAAENSVLKTSLAGCEDNIMERTRYLTVQACMYKALVLIWDETNRKVCIKKVKRLRGYPECPRDVDDVINNILALSSRRVDIGVVRYCTPNELQMGNYKITERLYNCFYRQEYFVWFGLRNEVCMKPKGFEPIYSKWKYCPKDVVDTMVLQGASRAVTAADQMQNVTKAMKRRAVAAMALLDLAEQPAKTAKYYDDLEVEISNWVRDGFNLSSTSVRNMKFSDQPGTSRDARALENTSLTAKTEAKLFTYLRKLKQASDSIFVKFTVVVDSRQVQGIDFAAELEQSMTENAHKFVGPGGNFQIDPSSIQVQEVLQSRITSSSPEEDGSMKHVIIVVIGGCLSIAASAGILLLWTRSWQSRRMGWIAHR